MSKRATKEAVAAAHDGPDYGAALAIINGRVATAKSNQSKASGEASQAWGSIEKMGIHKGGAQAAARVLGMDDEDDRQDFLRSFAKLLEEAGVTLKADLVDVAEGKHDRSVVPIEGLTPNHGRATPPTKPQPQPGPAGDTDLADGDTTPSVMDGGGPVDENAQERQGEGEPPVERAARKPTRRGHLSVVEAREAAQKHIGIAPDALG
jgi:hypothetical protein